VTQTKTKANSMARLVTVLFAITAVTALLLGLTNYITHDRIAEILADKTARSFAEVMPGDYTFEEVEGDWSGYAGKVTGVYAARDAAGVGGYVVRLTVSGSQGSIDMAVGVTRDAAASGVAIIDMKETAGLGAKASDAQWRSQFIGARQQLAVTKDGGTIDALTGATVTSRAVTGGVNTALQIVQSLQG